MFAQLIQNFIAGKLCYPADAKRLPVTNPATGEVTGEVALSSSAEVDQAVQAAKQAAVKWGTTAPLRRARVMFRFLELLQQNHDKLAEAITLEHGKTFEDAKGEVQRGIEVVEFASGIPHLLKGTFSEQVATAVDAYSFRQPLGVVAGITPFNFPAMVPMWMYPMAIACGNSFILKPSEKDPSASLIMAELLQQAGLPDGVFNVVQGGREAVEALLDHPGISAISFVGSTPIARAIYQRGTVNDKRVQALGGAKNHMIVLPDADVDLAADAAVSAAYGSAGERCMAISVVVAVGDVADDLVAAIQKRIPDLNIGPGDNPDSEMGPLITEEHRDRVAGYIETGSTEGATVVVDGREQEFTGEGFFLGASLIDGVTTDMTVYRDEIFGPVLSVVRVDTYAEGVKMISDNGFGNGAAIFTRDGGAARQFQQDADAGMVGINVPIPVPVGYHSFGGWKDSLFGDTTMYGPEGLRFYTRPKVVTSRWPDPSTSSVNLGFPQND